MIGVLSSLWMVACGGGAGVGSRSAVPRAGSNGAARSVPIPPLRYLSGDYDGDDYDAYRRDGDNDDSKLPRDRDNDFDNKSKSYYDRDDYAIRNIGHAADPAQRRTLVAIVKRYFDVAAAEDGAAGCSMLAPRIARSIPHTLGEPPGPPYLAGKTCVAIVSKVFKQDHRQLSIFAKQLRITDVRIEGDQAVMTLDMGTLPGRRISAEREAHVWKIDALLDEELP